VPEENVVEAQQIIKDARPEASADDTASPDDKASDDDDEEQRV
jgi:hypothetical protein